MWNSYTWQATADLVAISTELCCGVGVSLNGPLTPSDCMMINVFVPSWLGCTALDFWLRDWPPQHVKLHFSKSWCCLNRPLQWIVFPASHAVPYHCSLKALPTFKWMERLVFLPQGLIWCECSLKAQTHQPDIKELAAMKADCCVASRLSWPTSCTWTHRKDYSRRPVSTCVLRLHEREITLQTSRWR